MERQEVILPLDLTKITDAKVEQELFPCKYAQKFQRKFYRFNCWFGKSYPEFSSGRFQTEEAAQRGLREFLHGNSDLMFGNITKRQAFAK